MKNKTKLLVLLSLSIGIFLLYKCSKNEVQPTASQQEDEMKISGNVIPGKYIVVLKEEAIGDIRNLPEYEQRNSKMLDEVRKLLIKSNVPEVIPERIYHTAIKGFAATLNNEQVEKLKKAPEVNFIEEDKIISLGPLKTGVDVALVGQMVPYGIARVGFDITHPKDGTNLVAWIIDTGIDLTHPDLNVDVSRSVSFLFRGKNSRSPNDENGHGTHVSGTIAAKNNTIGVVGVAPNALVVAVRVLDQNGSGTVSGVINGVDYVAANGKAGDAANMSLGGGISTSLDNAVLSASNKGIFFAIAAGNSSANANNYSPAHVNGQYVYTVSAMDSTDTWAYFSNYGNPPIDFCAPGVNVLSTWKGGTYKRISGTSMATPHVAGVMLITNGSPHPTDKVNKDPDGNADPIVHL